MRKLPELQLDLESELFLVKAMALNNMPIAGGYDKDMISDNDTGHTFFDFEPIGDNYKEQAFA